MWNIVLVLLQSLPHPGHSAHMNLLVELCCVYALWLWRCLVGLVQQQLITCQKPKNTQALPLQSETWARRDQLRASS